jgi:hypothetical protein
MGISKSCSGDADRRGEQPVLRSGAGREQGDTIVIGGIDAPGLPAGQRRADDHRGAAGSRARVAHERREGGDDGLALDLDIRAVDQREMHVGRTAQLTVRFDQRRAECHDLIDLEKAAERDMHEIPVGVDCDNIGW